MVYSYNGNSTLLDLVHTWKV